KTVMAFHQLYRNTTLGLTLQDSLDELVRDGLMNGEQALLVLKTFDQCINTALASRVKTRVSFKGGLSTYRFCDNVWTFVLKDCEFKEVSETVRVDKVKIVACEGKAAAKSGGQQQQQ
ncbi:hypothetical protein BOX15_Mlig005559g1, partial [Macrostomum lignano]